MNSSPRRARPWLAGFVLVAFVILVSLGVWQLERLAWKRGLLARIEAAERTAPQRLATLLSGRVAPGELEFRPAFAYCTGIKTARTVRLYGLVDGRPGSRYVSACALSEGPFGAVLVDRGFAAEDVPPRLTVGDSAEVTRVSGVLRAAGERGRFTPDAEGGRWYWRDIAGMAAALGVARPAPVMLTSSDAVPEGAGLVAAPLPREVSNRHLEYALTWFGLAAALVGVYLAMLWRGRRA